MGSTHIDLSEIRFVGAQLVRPECVLATAKGALFTADWRGGVVRIASNGGQQLFAAPGGGDAIKPNGIALEPDGSFVIADLGEQGGLFRLSRAGVLTEVLRAVDGEDLPPSNYVLRDRWGRLWLTVSTRRRPRDLGYRADVDDGFIVLIDNRGARMVADGLGYTNEVQLSEDGALLYVNETFGRRMTRFRITSSGDLVEKTTITEFGPGTFPDGLAFDSEGCIWVTSIVSNRVIRVDPSGAQEIILEDSDPDHLDWVENAFQAGQLGRPHLDNVKSNTLMNISSLAFGGPDLKDIYLGCLLGDKVAKLRSPIAGRAPEHWYFDV